MTARSTGLWSTSIGTSHHVHLLYYIFADDETGRRVANALGKAVMARGPMPCADGRPGFEKGLADAGAPCGTPESRFWNRCRFTFSTEIGPLRPA